MTEEIQLVEQLVRGSKSAFKKIYDKYSTLIYNNIRKIVHPAQEAEDLLQEVFTVLWLKRATINPEIPIGNGFTVFVFEIIEPDHALLVGRKPADGIFQRGYLFVV